MQRIWTFDPKKNRKVFAGYWYKERGLFIKIGKSDYFMVKEKGYGIQESIITLLKIYGCKLILIRTKTTKLQSQFTQWLKKTAIDYGHGKQIFMPVSEMVEVK